jgi:hypothetical protein
MDDVKKNGGEPAPEEAQNYQDGYEAGHVWATQTASRSDVLSVKRFVEQLGETGLQGFFGKDWKDLQGYEREETLFCVIARSTASARDKDPRLCEAAKLFWRKALGDDFERRKAPDFLRGFMQGVVDVERPTTERK